MINLTVVSETNRTLVLIPIDTHIPQNLSYSNQIISNIDYNNYILKLTDLHTNISASSFKVTSNSMINDIILFTILCTIILCSFLFIKYLKKF